MQRWLLVGLVVLFCGCSPRAVPPHAAVEPTAQLSAPLPTEAIESAAKTHPPAPAAMEALFPDATEAAGKMQALAVGDDEFIPGEVQPEEFPADAVTKTATGFVIQMPSGTPVPTPTLADGKLFVGGGFSSQTFHAFDALTGAPLWSVGLSDDGPSKAEYDDGNIYFNTESCTLFALDAKTGQRRWAHYLGDPMMSAPAAYKDRVYTCYAAVPAEEPAKPKSDDNADDGKEQAEPLEGSYQIACFVKTTGSLVWRRWLDGDCISAPIVTETDVFVATMPGTIYRFNAADGRLIAAQHARATSAPTLVQGTVFFTRRVDDAKSVGPHEAIAGTKLSSGAPLLIAMQRAAPYLDPDIQRASKLTTEAGKFEGLNGFGGFGGGFGGGGSFAVEDEITLGQPATKSQQVPADDPFGDPAPAGAKPFPKSEPVTPPAQLPLFGGDKLAEQQLKAAGNLGLGNVSTLQGYQGSRIVHHDGHNYNVMGNELLCTTLTGEKVWSRPLEGDLKELGGHMAAPPVIERGRLYLATVVGKVLVLDPAHGELLHEYADLGQLRFSPAIGPRHLYVTTQEGKIHCLALK